MLPSQRTQLLSACPGQQGYNYVKDGDVTDELDAQWGARRRPHVTCGGPPTASTPTTADQPDRHNPGPLNPSGNKTSTSRSTTSATQHLTTTHKRRQLRREPPKVASRPTDTTCPSHTTLTKGRCHRARAGKKNRCTPRCMSSPLDYSPPQSSPWRQAGGLIERHRQPFRCVAADKSTNNRAVSNEPRSSVTPRP